MIEHNLRGEIPELNLKEFGRSFPPTNNKSRFHNILEAYGGITPPVGETEAPWKRIFIPAELPGQINRIQTASNNVLSALEPFVGDSPVNKYRSAKKLLRNITTNLAYDAGNARVIREAKSETSTNIIERAIGPENVFFLRNESDGNLLPSTKEVLRTAKRYFIWETIKDASAELSEKPNPFGYILDLHYLGAGQVRFGQEGILVTLQVAQNENQITFPYLIEK